MRFVAKLIAPPLTGLLALYAYTAVSLCCDPEWRFPLKVYDGRDFVHWQAEGFTYASSPIDLSALSPLHGLGGLVQPLGVWMHPVYLPLHMGRQQQTGGILLSYFVVILSISLATTLLGRAAGLPPLLAVLGAQLVAVFGFGPVGSRSSDWGLNMTGLYFAIPGIAIPVALATFFVALFMFLGTGSKMKSVLLTLLLPAVPVYSILCDPLYTPIMFVPAAIFCCGIILASPTRRSFWWRLAGVGACLGTALCLGLLAFYRSLSGYMARAVFPNEIYSEVQTFDRLIAFVFQGSVAALAVLFLVANCVAVMRLGSRQQRGFSCSVLGFLALIAIVSLIYLYSGIRWNLPSPQYFEHGAFPAYVVALLLGTHLVWQKVRVAAPRCSPVAGIDAGSPTRGTMAAYTLILLLPLWALCMGSMEFRRAARRLINFVTPARPQAAEVRSREPGRIMECLKEQLAIPPNGEFRGSVVTLVGVPGSPVAAHLGFADDAPRTKDNITCVFEEYLPRTFDDMSLVGLWDLGIPTLEENAHLVTPPFYYLISRALSRPKDYQSRNWAVVSVARPRLMAALGARFMVTDVQTRDPLLSLRTTQTNADGITLFLYEIANPNLGNFSPTKVRIAKNAQEAIDWMLSQRFPFGEEVILFDRLPLSTLVPAEGAQMYFERGGVRVKAKSQGTSLAVLPLQFSHSLEVVSAPTVAESHSIKLMRTNLLQTGVLFSGQIDIKLSHVFGLFRGTAGRQKDIDDCKQLGIVETGEIPYPSGYQPFAIKRR